MSGIMEIRTVAELQGELERLRRASPLPPVGQIIDRLEDWGAALSRSQLPGAVFLRLWLRRGTLEPMLVRELGDAHIEGRWTEADGIRRRSLPVGLVGHWPAGNVPIQPLLSMTCALLGGNRCLVRVPPALVEGLSPLVAALPADGALTPSVSFVSFDSARADLHRAMAESVDGAMIWGGRDAVRDVRALPFPPWTRLAVFGPRISAAAMDRGAWTDPATRTAWCQRVARDVWQFEQQACSSPHTLFVQRDPGTDIAELVHSLAAAFRKEAKAHPRTDLDPSLASEIARSRAVWLLDGEERRASFPLSPDWTILVGSAPDLPDPVGGRVLHVQCVDDLAEAIALFDGNVQTLGLAVADRAQEDRLADLATRRGVDRVVPVGRMHVFGSPWDGTPLVQPMTRQVVHAPASGLVARGGSQ